MPRRSKWYLLFLVLAALVLFSALAIPRIAVHTLEKTRGQIITVEEAAEEN